jgi:chloramphenicol O-acetyltransferase
MLLLFLTVAQHESGTISWSVTKYNKKYAVNPTTQIEQVEDKKKTVTGRRRNTIKTSYALILRLPSFYLY